MPNVASNVFRTAVLAMALLFVQAAAPANAAGPEIYQSGGGWFGKDFAVGGYDPVAYFKSGGPAVGKDAHTLTWKGAVWRFSSAENKAAFEADPEAYAPQYGGYCAYGVSQGAAVHGDPKVWSVVSDKLYLNINPEVQNIWNQDQPGYIAAANRQWPDVLSN